jgi:Tol biopolymer transport system component
MSPLKRSALQLAIAALAMVTPLAVGDRADAAALDPNIKMYTVETPHFRVNYPEGYDAIAQKAAQFAEEAHEKVSKYFGTVPKQKTEFTVFDHEDTVNGLAMPYMNNAMYVFLGTPDSDILWGRFDDFFKTVILHEYTHILHFETVEGLPKHINNVFGRVLFPNLFQPTFLIEGLAVTTETMMTPGGSRGNEHVYDMYLRADALNGRQLTIDQAGGYYLTDFPSGDTPYVYGTYFYRYIVEHYGADKPPAMARKYSEAPWLGVDYAVSQVIPGRDAQQIWDEMLHWIRRRVDVQVAEIKKKPLTQTTAVTTTGFHHHHPRYLPNGKLIFIEGLRHANTGLFELAGRDKAGQPILKKIMDKSQYGDFDISKDGRYLYFQRTNSKTNYYGYDDIFKLDLKTGDGGPITESLRANNPGISPDGKQLLAVINGRGNSNLRLLDSNGKFIKRLTDLQDNTQFTAPRWSPDGKRVIISGWRQGSRDLFMLDTDTWQTRPLWKDDAVDVHPVWTPDGKYVVFGSDRSGVYNLYAYDWEAQKLFQVTNVLTGAVEPAVSPDGKEIAFALAVKAGFDIHTIPFDESKWIPVPTPIFDPNIKGVEFKQTQQYPVHPYSPLPSLMPKFWSPLYMSGQNTLGAFTQGYDVLLTNVVFGMAGYQLTPVTGVPDGSTISPLDLATYTFLYQNSQWDTNVSLLASGNPVNYRIPLNNGSTLNLYQHMQAYSLNFGWNNLPSPLTNASYQTGDQLQLGLNVRNIRHLTPAAANQEAVDAKIIPDVGRSHSVSLTYKFNSNSRVGYSVSPERGSMTTYGAEVAHPAMASETEYYRLFADWRSWTPLPWTHHVFAARLMTGVNLGKPQGDFYLGGARSVSMVGTTDIRVAAEPDDILVPLRGYPFASTGGNTVGLLSAEYRFPLMEFQHGVGTLPFFAERLSGSIFTDAGTAYTNGWMAFLGRPVDPKAKLYPDLPDLRASLGAELRLHFKIANNPLNTPPLATIARMASPTLNAFNDAAGTFRFGVAQPVLPLGGQFLPPVVYTEFGTYF